MKRIIAHPLFTVLLALVAMAGLAQLEPSLGQRIGMFGCSALLVFAAVFGITIAHWVNPFGDPFNRRVKEPSSGPDQGV
jgi:hypothetical protein